MKLYLNNGYANIGGMLDDGAVFNVVIGGRGTGKTYGALCEMLDRKSKFILMRRTQAQADMINRPDFNPFKRICHDRNISVISESISKYNAGFFFASPGDEPGEMKKEGPPIGYTVALSTISNIRGFDASDVQYLIYDEFIPEKHDRPIKAEGQAFLNAYETINRNRELQGESPVKCLLLANANNLSNPILDALGVIDVVDAMTRKGRQVWKSENGTIAVYLLKDSPISMKKQDTVLYRLSQSDDFNGMALSNDFGAANYEHITPKVSIWEYRPLCTISGITIYKHKSDRLYYVTRFKSGSPVEYSDLPTEKTRWLEKYGVLLFAYENGRVKFADFYSKNRFMQLFQKQ